jgi:hypothetical protein
VIFSWKDKVAINIRSKRRKERKLKTRRDSSVW